MLAVDIAAPSLSLERHPSQGHTHSSVALAKATCRLGAIQRRVQQHGKQTIYGAYLFILFFDFQFSFFLFRKLGLFLLFPFVFVFTSLIAHFWFSVFEIECSHQSVRLARFRPLTRQINRKKPRSQ